MPELPPLGMEQLINVLYAIYYFIREVVSKLFEYTLFRGRPDLATLYGDALTILISLTAVYLLLELFAAARRIIKWLLLIGWLLLIVSMVAGAAGG